VSPDNQPETKEGDDFRKMSIEDRQAYNKAWSEHTIYCRNIEREYLALVQMVEELGDKADGEYGELTIVDVPNGVSCEIAEYDGMERIEEARRSRS
jgi:hypothetical protein